MKKLTAVILSVLMVLSFAACSASNSTSTNGSSSDTISVQLNDVDISAYPSDINNWTAQNLLDYFTDAGVFEKEDWRYIQDHATYYAGTPVDECAGYADEDGEVTICIFTFDKNNGESGIDDFISYVKENHKATSDLDSIPIDHMLGNVMFFYSETIDEDVYNKMDAAYNKLAQQLDITPDF